MSADAVLNTIREEDVAYVDIRFTDVRGKLQHVTVDVDLVDEDFPKKASCLTARPLQAGNRSKTRT